MNISTTAPSGSSLMVRDFYEENPFPGRLVTTLAHKNPILRWFWLKVARKTLFHPSNIARIRETYSSFVSCPGRILDAGCGTGELTCLLALAFPQAECVGGDLSSLNRRYAEQLKKALRINNLRFCELDLMGNRPLVSTEERPFDLITSCGVIHHLPNPSVGLRKLAQALHPLGRLSFAVYGRAYFREQYLRETLHRIAGGLPLAAQLQLLHDFEIDRESLIKTMKKENRLAKLAECLKGDFSYLGYQLFPHHRRSMQLDAFFHPQVKYYSPDTLFADAMEAGLEIIGFRGLHTPPEFARNSLFQSLSLQQKFALLDAAFLIPYMPICRRLETTPSSPLL